MYASLPVLERDPGSALLMGGDVLSDGRMLDRLVRSTRPGTPLIDREYSTANDDPVLISLRDNLALEYVSGSPWIEIGFPEEFTYANNVILPALQAKP
mgnify:CR=1 FL=1